MYCTCNDILSDKGNLIYFKERNIMQELLNEKIIEKESCLDIETKKQFFSYRVSISFL